MAAIVSITDLRKTFAGGLEALKGVSLDIEEGEILALLGPNGAGKTTLISAVCGITRPTSGRITVGGHDVITEFRAARSLIGLVPQEISLEPFETVMWTVRFSRGLFGKRRDDAYVERVLRQLSLWDKRDSAVKTLSGGMKRRVLIAKALSHEPRVLFLDEPTAGVDVELRKDMWQIVHGLKADGVTIILTTHYIEEAEAMADRVGVIAKGELLLVEEKQRLIGQGTVAVYIDAHSSAGVINDPQKSKVIGKIAYARWPKGPAGKRVTSIWNWGFPINAALPERRKRATWLFIQWAASKETQIATSYGFTGAYKRTGVNRTSLWQDPQYRKLMEGFGDHLADATTASFREDIDVEWRPRIPQWPAVGEIMATAVQSALVGQATPKDALADAQRKIEQAMRS